MTVVILGGAGFVGLNIANSLLEAGRRVILADLAPPPADAMSRLRGEVRFERTDVTDPQSLARTITAGTEALVYGAAITSDGVREAAVPEAVLEVNLVGFVRALRAAREAGVRRVVNLSSAGAYGDAAFAHDRLDEATTMPDPQTLYALSKFATERAGRRLAHLWQMDVRSVRLSGVFGAFERKTDHRDTPSPLFQIMEAARAGRPAILAHPGFRDWTYAADVGEAIRILIDAGSPAFDLYNISSPHRFSALAWGDELARRIDGFVCRLAEPGETPTIDLYGERDRASLAIDRLVSDLGFEPAHDLEGSLRAYRAWLNGA